jgi:16S rRNA processing protein RimM
VLPYGIVPEVSEALVGKRVLLRPPRPADAPRETALRYERWHKATWIIELANCSTREEAESLVGWEVCLAEEDRPPLGRDEYYADQLVGFRVVDVISGRTLGSVANVEPSTGSDLLEVEQENDERFLIPFVRALVKAVDLSAREVRVDLPEGLVEVNQRTKDV